VAPLATATRIVQTLATTPTRPPQPTRVVEALPQLPRAGGGAQSGVPWGTLLGMALGGLALALIWAGLRARSLDE